MAAERQSKSKQNHSTERVGIEYLLSNGYQKASKEIKTRILEILELSSTHTPRCFDLVRVEGVSTPPVIVTLENVRHLLDAGVLRLVEVKTTKKNIRDEHLDGYFFGATDSEFRIARHLGDRYAFVFVVMNSGNRFGKWFHVELTLDELEKRIIRKRVQYQVNLGRA